MLFSASLHGRWWHQLSHADCPVRRLGPGGQPAALTLWFAGFIPEIASGQTVREVVPWIPGLNVSLSFYLDGLSLTFALLICGIGTLIVIYSGGYLHGDPDAAALLPVHPGLHGLDARGRAGGQRHFADRLLGTDQRLVPADRLPARQPQSRRSALQALLVTSMGGLVMMAGLILLGIIGGSFELTRTGGAERDAA